MGYRKKRRHVMLVDGAATPLYLYDCYHFTLHCDTIDVV